ADQQGTKGLWRGASGDVLFPTTVALEALIRSGKSEYRPLINLGFKGLLDTQQAIGTWEDGRLPFPLQTVLVLDVFRIRHFTDLKIEQFAAAAVGFLRSAAGLRFIPGPVNRQIATIAPAPGCEYLMYARLRVIDCSRARHGAGGW